MTKLVDTLLREALAGSQSWQQADADRLIRENQQQDRLAG